ncbi:S24 family peptidase [Tenacibaculum maritimum]|nr:S24 family peptidase [Tenacibaculum maritimum]MDB0611822.1 S24 family peptidase [Tenacibaculum maritimum]
METTRQRIRYFIDKQGFKPKDFLNKTKLKRGVLDKSLDKSGVSDNVIADILVNYPNINPLWLVAGRGEMLINNTSTDLKTTPDENPTNVFKLKTDNNVGAQNIPLYNIEAAAGLVELFQSQADTNPIDTLSIPNLPKCDGAVFVTGDSMYPLLKSGDIVAYKQIEDFNNDIFWGEMYLISVEVAGEEYISVKYVQKSEKGEQYIKLVSQNQHHQPKNVKLNKVRAMALVKASVRINSMG